uniref:Viral A-type inclusion protein n=1 Tax=Panagrolaimus sp. ES5 TaxID=591445 RepID=A0AC34F102_9BILA
MDASTSAGGSSTSKKRKLTNDFYQNELDSMKQENEQLKKELEKQRRTIYNQAMAIGGCDKNAAEKLVALEKSETRLKSRIRELEKEIGDGQAEYQRILVEIRSTVSNETAKIEKDAAAKDQRIQTLEKQLASVRNVKPDPGYDDERKILQDQINKLQSSKDNSDKEIKELQSELKSKSNTETLHRKTVVEMQEESSKKEKLLQDQINKLQSTCNNYEKKIKEYESQFQLKTKNEAAFQSKIGEMKQQVEDQKKLYKAVAEVENKKIKELEAKLELKTNHGTSLQQNIDELKQQSENQKKLSQTKENEFKAAAEGYIKKIKDLEAKVASGTYNENVLKTKISTMKQLDENQKKLLQSKENEKKKIEAKVNELKTDVENLTKKITDGQQSVFRLQNHNIELADKISVSKNNEAKLQTQLEEVQQKEREARAIITQQEKKIQESRPGNLPFYLFAARFAAALNDLFEEN